MWGCQQASGVREKVGDVCGFRDRWSERVNTHTHALLRFGFVMQRAWSDQPEVLGPLPCVVHHQEFSINQQGWVSDVPTAIRPPAWATSLRVGRRRMLSPSEGLGAVARRWRLDSERRRASWTDGCGSCLRTRNAALGGPPARRAAPAEVCTARRHLWDGQCRPEGKRTPARWAPTHKPWQATS